MQGLAMPQPIRFELRQPYASGRRRAPCFYVMRIDGPERLIVTRPLFVLVARYGKIGTIGREVRWMHESLSRAVEQWGELAMRRRRHGYREVASCS